MLEHLSGESRLFPIIGDPIAYARSPQRLTTSFAARGHNAICVPLEVPDGGLEGVMHGLSLTANVDGLLITMPHKETAVGFCTTRSERSRLLNVVSVMRRNPDRSWHGEMLDGVAFVNAQIDRGAEPDGARVLLVGAGGAGSAIAVALLEAGVGELIVHDIDESKVVDLIGVLELVRPGIARIGPPDPTGCDIVCNATPLGMTDGDQLPVATDLLTPSMFVGDVVAGHGTTPLVRAAVDLGCGTATGDDMVDAVQQMMIDFLIPPGPPDSPGSV